MNKRVLKKWLPAIGFALAFVLLPCVIGFTGIRYRAYPHLEQSRLVFASGTQRTDQQYGVMNSGPALSLPGGRMELSWDIESDGNNVIRIQTENNAVIEPAEIHVGAGRSTGTVQLHALDGIYDLEVLVDYQEGSYIRVHQIDLTVGRHMDRYFTLGLLLLGCAVLCALWACGWLTPQRRGELVIVLTAVLIASIPELRGNLHTGHDSEFHLGRLLNMAHALRDGQFPVRLGAYMQNGYGAVMSVYYPELFLYIPALMMLGGATLSYGYHVLFFMMHLAAALNMWYAAAKIFKSDTAGVTASVLYTLSQYRLMDIYSRFAVGESLAMSVLPLFILGMYEVLAGDKRRWRLLALSAAMICQSHLITTALCGVISVCLAAVFSVKLVKERRIAPLVKAACFALLLNLFFFFPLYTYGQQGVVTSWMRRDLNEAALTPAQIFLEPLYVLNVEDDGLNGYPLGLGLPLVLAAAAALYVVLTRKKRDRQDVFALLLCLAGVGFAVMSTKVFPWGRVVSMTRGLAEYIQFPWRLLMLTTLCFTLAGGYAASRIAQERGALMQFAVLSLCAMCMLPLVSQETRKENYLPEGELPYWDIRFGDYVLPGSSLRKLDETNPLPTEGVTVSDYKKRGTSIDAEIRSEQNGSVVFPLYAFDGYEARLDGKVLEIGANENSHMQISFDAGMEGHLQVRFEGKTYWHIGDGISLAALLALVLGALKKKKAPVCETA